MKGVVLVPTERIPFLIQIKLAVNVIFNPSTIRLPSIVRVFKTTLVFKKIVCPAYIVTFAPETGTTPAAPVPQDEGASQFFLFAVFGVAKHYELSIKGF